MLTISGTASTLPGDLLEALFKYRYEVFIKGLGWKLNTAVGREVDQFDGPDALHIIALSQHGAIIGCARLLCTTGPYLLADVFPQLLDGQSAPQSTAIWELSRFASVAISPESRSGMSPGAATQQMLHACMDYALDAGAESLVSVSPLRIVRRLQRMGIRPDCLGRSHLIDGQATFACKLDLGCRKPRWPSVVPHSLAIATEWSAQAERGCVLG